MGYSFPSLHGPTYNAIMNRIQTQGIRFEDVQRAWTEFNGMNLSFLEGLTPAEMLASSYTTQKWLVSKAYKLLDLRRNGLGNVSQDGLGNWKITGKIQRKVSLQPAEMKEDMGMKLFKEIMHYTKLIEAPYEKALKAFRVLSSNFRSLTKVNSRVDAAKSLNEVRHGLHDFTELIAEGDSEQVIWTKFWDKYITPILERYHGKSVYGWSREWVRLDHTEYEQEQERDSYPSGPAAVYANVYRWIPKDGKDGKKEFYVSWTGTSTEDIDLGEADFASDNCIVRAEDFQAWKTKLILADVAMMKATRLDYTDHVQHMTELRAKARYIKINLQKEFDEIIELEQKIFKKRDQFMAETDANKQIELANEGKLMVAMFKDLVARSLFERPGFEFFMKRSSFYPNWFQPENLPEEKAKRTGWPQENLMRGLCEYSRDEKCKRNKTQLMILAMQTFPDKSFEFLLVQYDLLGGKPGKVDMRKIYLYQLSIEKDPLKQEALRQIVDCK
jgi:hypothetical protein